MNPALRSLSVCTVAASGELPNARVLAHSLRAHDPQPSLSLLVIDDPEGLIDAGEEPFTVLRPGDIGLEHDRFERLAALLPPPALRAAAKAWMLRFLWRDVGAPLVYLDPTARTYASLSDLVPRLRRHDLLLTPSLSAPLPDDGRLPGIRQAGGWGAYDPGLVGLGPAAALGPILDWWAERSVETGDAAADPVAALGWWIDEEKRAPTAELAPRAEPPQARLLDLVGAMARTAVLREHGWNSGYWNVSGSRVERGAEGWTVDGQPLRSFNFRGFDPTKPGLLSREQDRISLADEPGLARLCDDYAAALEEHGARAAAESSYAFETLADGRPFTLRLRRLYTEWTGSGAVAPSPFTQAGLRAFVDWLSEPAEVGGSLAPNRYLRSIYEERLDLHRAIPAGSPDFADRLADWARRAGRSEADIPPEFIPGPAGAAASSAKSATVPPKRIPAAAADRFGVNVIGFHRLDFGIAQTGRLVIEGLDACSIPLLPIHDFTLARYKAEGPPVATLGVDSARFPISLFCINGDSLLDLVHRKGRALVDEHYSIGLWAYEADTLPDSWAPAFELLDEIWAVSEYVAETVAAACDLPVTRIRVPLLREPAPPLRRAEYGIGEDEFIFFFMFDFDSTGARKNPLGVVEAFSRAFDPGSGAVLLLKSSFSGNAVGEYEKLRRAVAARPDVHLVDRRVSAGERNALLAGSDCYVSLHRSEGFGHTPAEAMLFAKPVIATAYGGNMDFMTAENSYLVDYELVRVGGGQSVYPPEAHWAEPDRDHAAELMRHVFENREQARERGLLASAQLGESHSPKAAGRVMEQRLLEIRQRLLSEQAGPARPRGRISRLLGRRDAAKQSAERMDLPELSAATLANLRAQERRVRELERARQRSAEARLVREP